MKQARYCERICSMNGLWNNTKTTLLMGGMMGLVLGIGYLLGGQDALIWALLLGGA